MGVMHLHTDRNQNRGITVGDDQGYREGHVGLCEEVT